MSTTPVTSTASQDILNSLARPKNTTTTSAVDDQQSRFLKLLTTQLKNQDPLNPTDSAEVTSQLAQISTVDGVERLNSTLAGLVTSSQSSQALQAASLIGKQVLIDGDNLQLSGGVSLGGVDLDGPADHVTVSIYDSNGLKVDTTDLGEMDAGSQMFVWDGSTTNGTAAVDGKYTIKVTATLADAKVTATPLEMQTVSSIVTGSSGLGIDLGNAGKVAMSDIKRIL